MVFSPLSGKEKQSCTRDGVVEAVTSSYVVQRIANVNGLFLPPFPWRQAMGQDGHPSVFLDAFYQREQTYTLAATLALAS